MTRLVSSDIQPYALNRQAFINGHLRYSPQGPISIISQFDPEKDKIDLTAYSGVTYPDLHFQQVGNNTDIRFIYKTTHYYSGLIMSGAQRRSIV